MRLILLISAVLIASAVRPEWVWSATTPWPVKNVLTIAVFYAIALDVIEIIKPKAVSTGGRNR